MKWQTVRRTPWFRWLLAFVIWVALSRLQGDGWLDSFVWAAAFALVMTALFQYLDGRKRS